MTSSVFLERNLRDLPVIDRGRRGDPFSGKKGKDQQDGTFLVSISTKKPMGVPEARDPSQSSAPRLIRRRLNFLDSDDDFNPNPNPVFDFTDKMAAFREILKKDSERDAERNKKMGKTGREISTEKKKEGQDNDAGFPRSREARRLLQRLADEKLTRSDQPRQYLECVIDSSSKQEKRMETPKRQSKSEDYLDKFLPERTHAKTSSSQKKGSRFPNKAALDKTPRKEISTPQLTDRNIPLYPENSLLQEPDLLMNDNMSLTSTVSRKTGKGSIQSNVPHYHPSYVSPKEAPSESVRSQSKQPNLKGLGLCEGVRTGEVIITKSRMGKTPPTNTKGTSQSARKEKGRALTLEDLSTHPNTTRSKRKKHRERRSDKSEGKLRKDRTEIEEDLDISDSSKENDKKSRKANRKANKDQMAQEDGESSAEAPRVEGLLDGDQQYNQTARKPVFGPRHPEIEGEGRRGNFDGAWRPPEGSVSGSVRSIGSQSSTIMAVELLRKLYNVDPRTRQDLILKAKCFRRWLKNVQSMQSIDERNPYAQSGPEAYVGVPTQGRGGLLGSARLTETDSDDIALLCFNAPENQEIGDHNGVGTRANVQNNDTNFIRYDTKFGEHCRPDEKITKKVAPITKENLERHTQIVQSTAIQPFSNVRLNEKPSAFTIVKPQLAHQKDLQSENDPFQIPQTMKTRGHISGPVVTTTKRKLLYPQTQYDSLNPDLHGNLYTEATEAGVSVCKPIVCAASKCVTDSARIARGLGRSTNRVLPSTSDSFTQLLDTANYGVCLQSAETFHRRRVQKDFFLKWKKMAAERVMIRAADNLHCLHSLKKGMNAFKWAINRSKIMVDIYQNKLKGILVTATFFKWKELAIKSRQERMQKAFKEWRYFTEESQKVRYMQESMDHKLLIRMMKTWQKRFQIKVKENSAHNHFRRRVMTHTLTAWRIYTLESKEKQKREEIASNLYKERLQSKIFTCMIILYRKLCLAKLHHKNHSLNKMLHEWKRAAAISREEYDQSLAQSQEHYQRNQLRHCFSNWHDLYLTERAMTATNQKLARNAFVIWKMSWQHQVHYREEIHARIRHKILSTSLTCWRENVAVLKRRREAAVVYLQRVLVRHSLLGWKEYTQHKKQLRMIQRSLTNRLNIKMQQRIMSHWRDHMEKRLNLRQAQTFWSNTCARKSVVQWKKFCHKRALLRLLNDTEPIRKQNLLNRMFQKWLSFKERIESENEEVSETRGILERSQLARRFCHWKAEALLKLRVRPLVQQRQARLLSESFSAWHSLVQQKKECRRNKAVFSKITLGKLFCKWRQQFTLRAVERDVRQRVKTNFVRRCLIGWRKVIQRKRAALLFHNQQLVKQTFVEWRYKAIHQMKERLATKQEQEYNSWLLKSYFNSWRSNAQQQRRQREDILNRAQESRTTQQIISCFGFWRHHLRATIVAREHQRMLQRRLMTRVIVEWHSVAERCMKRAVQEFAVRIGLQTPEDISGETLNSSEDSETSERLQLLTDMMMAGSENTSGIHSPVASSTLGTPMKRLYSPALSRISLDLDKSFGEGTDYKLTLANTSFIDARFEMEQAVKTERMKILVTTAVQRIQFWPISIIFGNWRNHTLHQKELHSLLKQATDVIQMLKVKCAFRMWKGMCRRKTQSRNFREECLKRHVLEALQENKRKMKYKKQLSSLAVGYHSLTVFRKIFPVWFEKAQELRHTRCVVHIWNTETEEEQALVPIEDTLHSRLSTKTLRKCLAVWHLKFMQIDRLRKTYHKIIQQKFFEVWREWAQRKAQLRRESQKFNNHRIQSLAFHMWTIRQKQMVVIEEKVKNSQVQNLRLLIQNWHRWTIESKQKQITRDIVMRNHQRNLVLRTFVTWRDQAEKCRLMARRCQQRLMIRILREWEEVTIWKKEMKRKALSFQVKSYTKQVIRMFKEWHSKYLEHVQQHEEHEAYIRRRVLKYGRHWKKQTQKARGRQLHCVLRNRQVASCFAKWKYAFERNLERENQLNKYIVRKNRKILETYLDHWKMRLLSNQATRLFNVKLLRTLFCEWHNFASNSNQRKHNLAVYQRALEQRSLKSYFHYWYSLTQVQNDIKKHCHLKIQIRVLREWHLYAQRRRQLATLGSVLSKYVQRETLKRVWYTFKVQADYCVNLNDTATKILMEKNGRCMQWALTVWRKRLNDIIAGRCYHHLLARRSVRQWKCFVKKRKEEKEVEKQNTKKAVRHYNQHMCKIAFRALYNEVRVKHQLQVHVLRIQKKYGGIWKQKVDMVFTAVCVEEERLLSQSWKIWRLAFARQQAARRVTVYNERQILSQTFVAWKEVCFERKEKVRSVGFYLPTSEPPVYKASQLPTPVNRYQSKGSRKS